MYVSPFDASVNMQVYDQEYGHTTASLGSEGETMRNIYDNFHRKIALVGPDENLNTLSIPYYSRSATGDVFSKSDTNRVMSIVTRNGGVYDDFYDEDTHNWSFNTAGWYVGSDKKLHNYGVDQGDCATLLNSTCSSGGIRVKVDHISGSADFGLLFGSIMIRRNGSNWEYKDASGVQGTNPSPMAEDWLLIIQDRALLFYADNKLIFSDIRNASTTAEFKLYTGETNTHVTFDDIFFFKDPMISMVYMDGMGKTRQSQTMDGKDCLVSEIIYDEFGRAAIKTKASRILDKFFGFDEGYVIHDEFADPEPSLWDSGVIEGTITGYHSTDNGYPYSRTIFEESPLSRVIENGLPGQEFAYEQGHTSEIQYTRNMNAGFMDNLPIGQYFMHKTKDPNGVWSSVITSKDGKTIAKRSGPVIGPLPVNETVLDVGPLNPINDSFTAPHTGSVQYSVYKEPGGGGPITYIHIGTTPGGTNVVNTEFEGRSYYDEFDVQQGVTYYVNITSNKEVSITITRDYWGEGQYYPTTAYEYDVYGNNTKIYPPNYFNPPDGSVNPDDYITEMTYDFLGRLKTSSSPDAGITRFIYDKTGKKRFMMDGNGESKSYDHILYWKYDILGRIIEEGYITNQNWNETSLQNYADNNPSWPATPATWRTKNIFDGDGTIPYLRGRLYKKLCNNDDDNDAVVEESYVYNIFGNVIQKDMTVYDYNSINYPISYQYDNLGNITKITYMAETLNLSNETITSTKGYEAANTINAGPAFTIESGANVTITAGEEITLLPGFWAKQGCTFTANINQIGSDDGMEVVYTYNDLGQNTAVGIPGDPDYYATYTYNTNGSISEETLNNNAIEGKVTRSYAYNSPGWLTEINDDSSFFNENISYTSNGYGGVGYYNGNIASTDFFYKGINTSKYRYLYDNLRQLKVADNTINNTMDVGVYGGNEIQYDANGNILSITREEATNTYTYFAGRNQVQNTDGSGNDYVYDSNGNVTVSVPKDISSIAYDPFLNMTTAMNRNTGAQVNFTYAAGNRRVLKHFVYTPTSTNVSTLYIHGANDYPLMEKVSEPGYAENTAIYIYGPRGLIATNKDNTYYYVLKDHIGSTRVVFNTADNTLSTFDYMPFGDVVNTSGSGDVNYHYTGQEEDTEISLHNFRARFYDSDLARFYAMDPMMQMASPYAAMGNNPIIYLDKDGKIFGVDDVFLIAVMVWGGLQQAADPIMKGAEFSEIASAFGKGAIVTGVSTIATAGIGSIISPTGAVAGAAYGAATGGLVGGIASWAMNDFKGGIFNSGMVSGAISGAIFGGIQGYNNAQGLGLNGWTGAEPTSLAEFRAILEARIAFGKTILESLPPNWRYLEKQYTKNNPIIDYNEIMKIRNYGFENAKPTWEKILGRKLVCRDWYNFQVTRGNLLTTEANDINRTISKNVGLSRASVNNPSLGLNAVTYHGTGQSSHIGIYYKGILHHWSNGMYMQNPPNNLVYEHGPYYHPINFRF